MIKISTFILILSFCLPITGLAQSPLKICVDNRYWYPFVYQEESRPAGMFVEMVREAFYRAKIPIEILAVPIKRCVNILGRTGKIDAAIGLPYTAKYNELLEYPADATEENSAWRLMQVDFNLVTPIASKFEFSGQLNDIPPPIRIPKAYTNIIHYFESQGIRVETSKEDESTFYKLIRDKEGSLITTSIMADRLGEATRFKNKFVVHPKPIASISYFLTFFSSSRSDPELRQTIWRQISALRDDYIFMLQLLSKY